MSARAPYVFVVCVDGSVDNLLEFLLTEGSHRDNFPSPFSVLSHLDPAYETSSRSSFSRLHFPVGTLLVLRPVL